MREHLPWRGLSTFQEDVLWCRDPSHSLESDAAYAAICSVQSSPCNLQQQREFHRQHGLQQQQELQWQRSLQQQQKLHRQQQQR